MKNNQASVLFRLVVGMLVPGVLLRVHSVAEIGGVPPTSSVICCLPLSFMVSALAVHLPSLSHHSGLDPLARLGLTERLVYYALLQSGVLHTLQYLDSTLSHGLGYLLQSKLFFFDARVVALYMIQDYVWRVQSWANARTTLAPWMLRVSMVLNFVVLMLLYGAGLGGDLSVLLSTHLVALCITDLCQWLFIAFSKVAVCDDKGGVPRPVMSIAHRAA